MHGNVPHLTLVSSLGDSPKYENAGSYRQHDPNASQSSMLPMKEVGRPFCVMKMRRCVSPTRFRQAARLLRHSEKEMTSSERRGMRKVGRLRERVRKVDFALATGIAGVPVLMARIVHDCVHRIKGVAAHSEIMPCHENGFLSKENGYA